MTMRLRQVAFVAGDLAAATEELTGVLGIEVAFRDPGVGKWGLENIVAPIGGEFLEIVAPVEEGTSAGRYLKRRGGAGGYMVILQTEDALAARARILADGVRAVAERDGPDYVYTHFHPADVGGILLSVDSMPDAGDILQKDAAWTPAGPDWRRHVRTQSVTALTGVDLQVRDPLETGRRWARWLELPLDEVSNGAPFLQLAGARIRFLPDENGTGPGLVAIRVAAANRGRIFDRAEARGLRLSPDTIQVVGCRVHVA